jgi:cysteine-rich repeat protein
VRVDTGVDDSGDGVLDLLEIDNTAYVCNGLTPAICGDGRIGAGEDCDTGGVDSATCDSDCTAVACGDGHVNAAAMEECDDSNQTSEDGCSLICRVEPAACTPNTRQCDGPGVQTCLDDGTWGPTEACPGTQHCALGLCID